MSAPLFDIGIVGCGTAGGAAAVLLGRAGHRVTVYERVPEPGPVGAGIMLQPSGQAVLARLGLLDDVVRRGARIDRLLCTRPGGRVVLDLWYRDVEDSWAGFGLHRGVLFNALFAAVKSSGITLRTGISAARVERIDGGRRVLLLDESGERHGPHDLILVADGARSQVQIPDSPPRRVRRYPWGALWFVGVDPEGRYRGLLRQTVRGTGVLIGLLPTGRGPDSTNSPAPPLVSFFYSLRGDRYDAFRATPLGQWKARILHDVPDAAAVLAQIHDASQLIYAGYHDVVMPRWHCDRVAYLGDAAHATSPQLGQGSNLALVDAAVLADCLAEDHPLGLAGALAEYSARRRDHLRWYQFATRWLTPFFQSDLFFLGWLRDSSMQPATRLAFVRRLMTSSMAGLSRGPFQPQLPLPVIRALPGSIQSI